MYQIPLKALALTAVTIVAGCANQSNTRVETSPINEPPAAATEQYDLAKGATPGLAYNLVSLDALIAKVDALGGPQKEFETDQAFIQRMASLGPFTTCAEVVKPHIRFNSTTGSAAFEYLLIGAPYWSDEKSAQSNLERYPSTRIGQKSTELGKSVGQNAYGAKATISSYKLDNLYIVMNPIKRASLMDSPSPKLVGKAKQALLNDLEAGNKVEMCFDAVPVRPYVRYEYGSKEATINDPTSTVVTSRNIRVAVTRFYLKGGKPQSDYVEDLRFSR
jgi:hypothetical protein